MTRTFLLTAALTLLACSDKTTDTAAPATGSTTGTTTTSPGTTGGTPTGTATGTTGGTPTGTTTTGSTSTTTSTGSTTVVATTPATGTCASAAMMAGALDPLQTPGDGMVIFCHLDQNGTWFLMNVPVGDCLTHINHADDLFPNTICDS